jgi:hypothetical protein
VVLSFDNFTDYVDCETIKVLGTKLVKLGRIVARELKYLVALAKRENGWNES